MPPKQQVVDFPFPYKGIHRGTAYENQPEFTTDDAQNVRVYDVDDGRARGGQRPGIKKWSDGDQFGGGSVVVQHLNSAFTSTSTEAKFNRAYIALVIAAGAVYADRDFDNLVEMTRTLSSTSTDVRAVSAFQFHATDPVRHFWMVDGRNYEKLDIETNNPIVNTDMTAWTASGDGLPSNGSETCRLIAHWRNRCVLSGLVGDDHNWFMSAVGDFEDFDYSPAVTTTTQAVAGNNAEAGKLQDTCTALINVNDDYLIYGGDASIWVMRGDPAAGGALDRISDSVGVAWGDAWCKDERGNIYLWTTQGLARIPAGTYFDMELLSRYRLDDDFKSIDLATHRVRLAYDVVRQGVNIFITPLSQAATTHYWYDVRTDSFWKDVIPAAQGPTAAHTLDGDLPADRIMLMGGFDGYVRQFDDATKNDDSTTISSYVLSPPVRFDRYHDMKLTRLTITTGSGTDSVTWSIGAGDDVAAAVANV